mmetsp:Transcript_6070/g.14799  ORF Transcript_6070/g.14799 Transcript_6070/m.14799 type:complete len:351 (-) Transcript_6070:5557-6609(-)
MLGLQLLWCASHHLAEQILQRDVLLGIVGKSHEALARHLWGRAVVGGTKGNGGRELGLQAAELLVSDADRKGDLFRGQHRSRLKQEVGGREGSDPRFLKIEKGLHLLGTEVGDLSISKPSARPDLPLSLSLTSPVGFLALGFEKPVRRQVPHGVHPRVVVERSDVSCLGRRDAPLFHQCVQGATAEQVTVPPDAFLEKSPRCLRCLRCPRTVGLQGKSRRGNHVRGPAPDALLAVHPGIVFECPSRLFLGLTARFEFGLLIFSECVSGVLRLLLCEVEMPSGVPMSVPHAPHVSVDDVYVSVPEIRQKICLNLGKQATEPLGHVPLPPFRERIAFGSQASDLQLSTNEAC